MLLDAGPLAATIPTALLAGILIKVGIDIIDWGFLLRAHRLSMKTAVVMYGVLLMTVFWGLIWGVLVGVFVTNLLTIESLTEAQLEGMATDNSNASAEQDRLSMTLTAREQQLLNQCGNNDVMLFRLRGPLSFGAARRTSERMGLFRSYFQLL